MLFSNKVSIKYSPLKDIVTISVNDISIADIDYPQPNECNTYFDLCKYVALLHINNELQNFETGEDIKKHFNKYVKMVNQIK